MQDSYISILGANGFVGSYISEMFPHAYKFIRNDEYASVKSDILFCSCVPAVKWKANKYPEEDLEEIESIKNILKQCTFKKIVLISTVDIYTDCDYGKNRLLFEKWIKFTYPESFIIIRLPALFGMGLKKNIIYDILDINCVSVKINTTSVFQWYDLEWLGEDINHILSNNIIENDLFSEPISNSELVNSCFESYLHKIELFDNDHTNIIYNFNPTSPIFFRDKNKVIEAIKRYIRIYENIKNYSKKLVVSNLAWGGKFDKIASIILRRHSINKVELAPTLCAPIWANVSDSISKFVLDTDLEIYSLQSLFYGVSDIDNISKKEEIVKHFKSFIVSLVKKFNIKVLVFGSPTLRTLPGTLEDFIDVINNISILLNDYNGCLLCIEANSKKYGCDIAHNLIRVNDVVSEFMRENVKINFDTGCAIMENEKKCDIDLIWPNVRHIQLSTPNLKSLNNNEKLSINKPTVDTHISIEMIGNIENLGKNIRDFLSNFEVIGD